MTKEEVARKQKKLEQNLNLDEYENQLDDIWYGCYNVGKNLMIFLWFDCQDMDFYFDKNFDTFMYFLKIYESRKIV
jgi:hypothetical protein